MAVLRRAIVAHAVSTFPAFSRRVPTHPEDLPCGCVHSGFTPRVNRGAIKIMSDFVNSRRDFFKWAAQTWVATAALAPLAGCSKGVTARKSGWVFDPLNPVLGSHLGVCFDPCVLRAAGGYRMWFSWRPLDRSATPKVPTASIGPLPRLW